MGGGAHRLIADFLPFLRKQESAKERRKIRMRGMFGDRDIPVADDRDVAQNPRADRHALAPAPLRLVVAAVERQQDEFAARQSLLLAAANQPRYVLGEAREELARLFEANDGRQAVKARGIRRRSDLSLPLWIQKIVQAPRQILFCKQLLVVRDADIARRLAQQPPVHLHHRRRDVGKRLAPGKTGERIRASHLNEVGLGAEKEIAGGFLPGFEFIGDAPGEIRHRRAGNKLDSDVEAVLPIETVLQRFLRVGVAPRPAASQQSQFFFRLSGLDELGKRALRGFRRVRSFPTPQHHAPN